MKPPRSVFFALLILANLVWAMSFAATSVATRQMSPIFLTMTRLFVGELCSFPLSFGPGGDTLPLCQHVLSRALHS
ncbi:hypothetical protein [Alicyclobacillus fastidiosus]|uniref:hypothetical protein n=1 Tax=Alicyclobacillus fastidiosus TaxID=392011 RepID=UPI0034D68AFF